MVHRPADSRLLANLLIHEKEYAKRLLTLLDSSHLSLASLSAYAAASPPPMSHVIIAVAGSLSSADDALQRYAASVNDWRHYLKGLKELEEEVGNILRDREILVTRLIKVSKYQKSTTNRDSLHALQPSTSMSTSSLRSDLSFSGASKLTQAHSELQACEAHLAEKERELWERRTQTVREGLRVRCAGMVECGRAWGEIGKEALELLEGMDASSSVGIGTGLNMGVDDLSNKPLPVRTPRQSSDLSSLAPSQCAPSREENVLPARPPSQHLNMNASMNTNANTDPHMNASHMLQIPPAHSISEFAFPTSDMITPQRVLPRRITEEDLRKDNQDKEGSSAEEEVRPVQVVENPRFALSPPASGSHEGSSPKKFSIRRVVKPTVGQDISPVEKRERKPSAGLGFFGSLRGLFRKDLVDVDVGWEGEGSGDTIAMGKRWGGEKRWVTRTDQNLKKMKVGKKGSSSGDGKLLRSASLTHSVPPAGGRRLKKANSRRKAGAPGSGDDVAVEARLSQVQDRFEEQQHELGPEGGEDVDRRWVSDGGFLVVHSHSGPGANGVSGNTSKGKKSVTGRDQDSVPLTSATGMQGGKTVRRKRLSVDVHGADQLLAENGGRARRAVSMGGRPPSTSLVPPQPQPSSAEKTVIFVTTNESHTATGTRVGTAVSGNVDVVRPTHMGEGSTSLMSIVDGVARQNREGWASYIENLEAPAVTGSGGSLGVAMPNNRVVMVKAPPPVSRGELDAVVAPRARRPGSPPASWSSPALILTGDAERVNGHTRPSLQPTKMPLRSAMRSTSRTPSPLPPSSLRNFPGLRVNGRGKKRDKGKWKEKEIGFEIRSETTDDEASASSYETGHETFQEEDAETEQQITQEERKTLPVAPSLPTKDVTVTSVVQTIPVVAAADHSLIPNGNQNRLGSDVSTSTETPTAAAPHPVPPSQRRKSVRVSLQPTFSPSPPAFEDDTVHSLWNGVGSGDVGGSWPSRSRIHYSPEEGGVWQDSSEEDEEYKRARRLLTPTLRREKKLRY